MERIVDSLINYQRLLILVSGLLLVFAYASRDIGELDRVKEDINKLNNMIYVPVANEVYRRTEKHYRPQWADAFRRSTAQRSDEERKLVERALANAQIGAFFFAVERSAADIKVPLPRKKGQENGPATLNYSLPDSYLTVPLPGDQLIGANLAALLPEAVEGARISIPLFNLTPEAMDMIAELLLANGGAAGRSGLLRITVGGTFQDGNCIVVVDEIGDLGKGPSRTVPCSPPIDMSWPYRRVSYYAAPAPGVAARLSDFFAANGTLRNKPLKDVLTAIEDQKTKARTESVELGGIKFPPELVTWPFIIVIGTVFCLMLAELGAAHRLLTQKPVEAPTAKTIGWFAMLRGLSIVPMLALFIALPVFAVFYALCQLGGANWLAIIPVGGLALWFAIRSYLVAETVQTKANAIGDTLAAA